MRTSNPPSYDKIFTIYNATGTLTDYVVPPHRGLLLSNTSTTATNVQFTVTNMDGTTATLPISPGSMVLPLQIQKITVGTSQTTIRIYGLL